MKKPYCSTERNASFAALTVAVALALLTPISRAATWEGDDDDNWSTPANWSDAADPAGKDILFNNTGAAGDAATLTSIVDADYSVGHLTFENTTGNHQNLQVAGDVTLTSTGTFNSNRGGSAANVTRVAVSGDGAFAYDNSGGTFFVGQSTTSTSISQQTYLDMSDLATLSIKANNVSFIYANYYGSAPYNLGDFSAAADTTITANSDHGQLHQHGA